MESNSTRRWSEGRSLGGSTDLNRMDCQLDRVLLFGLISKWLRSSNQNRLYYPLPVDQTTMATFENVVEWVLGEMIVSYFSLNLCFLISAIFVNKAIERDFECGWFGIKAFFFLLTQRS